MVPKHPSIIWVEDDDNDIILFKRAFSKTEISNPLKIFNNAESTLQYLTELAQKDNKDELPILILLDIKLPGDSGFSVLKWIREHNSFNKTPVIILSSSKETKDVIEAYDLGANSYVTKPYNYAELKEFVELIKDYWLSINQHPYYL
jgi:two-component system response regulator